MAERFVAYYRVSTAKQGSSGLGLQAQQKAVRDHIGDNELLGEFIEVESGKQNDRPQLAAAMRHARVTHGTLVVAKLDRLSRNAAFLNELFDATLPIRCVDMPFADRFAIGIMAQVAQWERERISERTRSALAAAKARGKKLGGKQTPCPEVSAAGRQRSIVKRKAAAIARRTDLLPYVDAARTAGCSSLRGIADFLNRHQIPTARGGKWHAANVSRLLGGL